MVASVPLNRVYLNTATAGTGTITLGSVKSAAFCTVADAGGADGNTFTYILEEGLDFEIGQGVYTAAGTTLTRATVYLSRIAGVAGTTKMTLAGTATVRLIESKEDLAKLAPLDAPTFTTSLATPNVTINGASSFIEIGAPLTVFTPFIDWHSSGNNIDYDARILASGGTGVAGNGALIFTAAGVDLTGAGSVTATTQANGDSSTKVATTAFALANGPPSPPQGRLTLQTATPVMTTTQSAKTTIFYTPAVGAEIWIYDGTNWVAFKFSEFSVATTDTTKNPAAIGISKVNDWFVWNDAGTLRLSHGPDWTNDTTRSAGTALVMQDGIRLNSVSITNGPAASRGVYVGTTRSNGSSQLDYIFGASASGGTAGFFGLWNTYNRRLTVSRVVDTGVSYTYTSATVRQARASAGNQISFVCGLAEDAIAVTLGTRIDTTAAGAAGYAAVALDSTTTAQTAGRLLAAIGGNIIRLAAISGYTFDPQVGFHFVSSNEASDGAVANSFNVDSISTLTLCVWN